MLLFYSEERNSEALRAGDALTRIQFMRTDVSVILPVYNTEAYLEDCINSLLQQTLSSVELIFVDDGSTDNSCSIIEEYQKKDPRIHLVRQSNAFAGAARNNGLQHASGEYVIFLDSDDFFEPDMLEELYAQGKKTDADIVLFTADRYDQKTGQFLPTPFYLHSEYLENLEVFSRNDIPDKILTVTTPAPWSKMFRRAFVQEENLQFQTLINTNDLYFTFSALCIAERITYLNKVFTHYRINLPASTQKKKDSNPLCFIEAYKALYEELSRRDLFSTVEKSFCDVFASTCAYYLKPSAKTETVRKIAFRLAEEDFVKEHVLNHEDSFFISKGNLLKLKECRCIAETYAKENTDYSKMPFILLHKASLSFEPLVSVIVPVYNVSAFIDRTLDSLVKQTLREIEIICINDGSSDDSLERLLAFAATDNRISVYTQENCGLSATRNRGIRQASGKYLYYMDSDDLLEPETLEVLTGELEENNLDSLYFNACIFCEDTDCDTTLRAYEHYYDRNGTYSGVYTGEELMEAMLSNKDYKPSACLQICRRDFFLENDLWFINGITHEDNIYTFKAMLCAGRTSMLDRPFFNRRIRKDSIMTTPKHFHNVYGYFISYTSMIQFYTGYCQDHQGSDAIMNLMYDLLNNARHIYSRLPQEQKKCYIGLSDYNRVLFRLYIDDFDPNNMALNEAKQKLSKANAEKSDLNKKLEKAKKEKSSANTKLKNANQKITELQKMLNANAVGKILLFTEKAAKRVYRKGKSILKKLIRK